MSSKRTIGLLSAVCLLSGCAGPSQLLSSRTDESQAFVVAGERSAQPDAAATAVAHAYLYAANLKGADLRGADLYRCQLSAADLTNADLRDASLVGAYLFKADLRGADLRGARFSPALKGAELKQTGLVGARFDASTQLPFSADEALRRGMIWVQTNEEVGSSF